MPLTILSDVQISDLLHNITQEDLESLKSALAEALHEYSTGTQEIATCQSNQPGRQHVSSSFGKTLFMPSQSTSAIGIKVVSLQDGNGPSKDDASIAETTSSMSHVSFTDSSSTLSSVSRSSTSSRSSGSPVRQKHPELSTATSFSHHYSALSSTHPTDLSTAPSTSPKGTLTLLSSSGTPTGFLAAQTLTAFRTALASMAIFSKRTRVHTIVIFGSGAQAYWAIRLALLSRGREIHHVRIINRSFTTAGPLLKTIYTSPLWTELRNANPKLDFTILTKEFGEYEPLLKRYIREADAIFCTVPSTEPLFPGSYLTSGEGRRKGRYLSMIGSYQPHMCEIDPQVLRHAVEGQHSTKAIRSGGAVVVDSLDACLKEAGEIIQAKLEAHQLVELGELIMIKRANIKEGTEDEGLLAWLREGNVVYKSVGVGVMDLAVGGEVVKLAREKGVGTVVEGF